MSVAINCSSETSEKPCAFTPGRDRRVNCHPERSRLQKNPKLARHIADASWGELVRQLEYKAKCYNRTLVKVDRWFPSSKRCGSCGYVVESLPLNLWEWDCPNCAAHHDRDINGARNILAVGHTVAVCGASVRPDRHESKGQLRKTSNGKKQKPKS